MSRTSLTAPFEFTNHQAASAHNLGIDSDTPASMTIYGHPLGLSNVLVHEESHSLLELSHELNKWNIHAINFSGDELADVCVSNFVLASRDFNDQVLNIREIRQADDTPEFLAVCFDAFKISPRHMF
ncbi:hypothetical protein IFM46972_08688 [Aspergillus udagawae]|uniref:Uncharacterized protein n=1 Tax=Aspergillus udagawae TaxID=91492 RepID=A0A8H3P9E5_9EURO|nr:hypothetical protein IFM46972_08688 [Aspergillus udagawae]